MSSTSLLPGLANAKTKAFLPIYIVTLGLGSILVLFNLLIMGLTSPLTTMVSIMSASLIAAVPIFFYLHIHANNMGQRTTFKLALAWGSIAGTGLAMAANEFNSLLIGERLTTVLAAPFIEECIKVGFIVIIMRWGRGFVTSQFDLLLWAGLTGVGFAFTENITYFVTSYLKGGGSLMGYTIGLRATTFYLHALFASIVAIGVWKAWEAGRKFQWTAFLPYFACAVGLHSLWNSSAFTSGSFILIWGSVTLYIFFTFLMIRYILACRKEAQETWESALLALQASGRLTREEAFWLSTPTQRQRLQLLSVELPKQDRAVLEKWLEASQIFIGEHVRYLREGMKTDTFHRGRAALQWMELLQPSLQLPRREALSY